jgi:prepilin-type N-terminal cleavage/methylation domain-containing protein
MRMDFNKHGNRRSKAMEESRTRKGNADCIRDTQGFTLMELMITIAIMAILSAIAIPNAIAWRNNAQFNASVRRVKDTIEATRMAAVKSHLPADFIFASATSYDTQTREVAAGAVALRPVVTHPLDPGVTMAFNNGGQITFNSRGMPVNGIGGFGGGTATIQHSSGNNCSLVVISSVGSCRIDQCP